MSVTIHDIEQGTKEWLELRKNKITGTKAADLLTKGKKHALQNNDDNFVGNYYTRRGHALEPHARTVYEEVFGVDVQEIGFVTNSLYDECGYSPDGICGNKLIEIKCFGEPNHMSAIDNIPFKVLAQIHFGMMICELNECDLIFYNPDIKIERAFVVKNIKCDTKIINNFIDKLNE